MADLSRFADERFDLIVHPCSNLFVPDVHPVWREAFRVLRSQGMMLSGFINPTEYIFDFDQWDNHGVLKVQNTIPFSSLDLNETERERYFGKNAPIEFSHSFVDQMGGQMKAGFLLAAFDEEYRENDLIGKYMPSFFATKAIKP